MNNEFIISVIALVLTFAGMWKVFEKAGKPGWTAIIPIYNLYIITKIVNKPGYWVILMLIPYIGIIWSIWSFNLLSKSFGKDAGYTLGLFILPFIFFPLLGYGEARYEGIQPESDDLIIDAEVTE